MCVVQIIATRWLVRPLAFAETVVVSAVRIVITICTTVFQGSLIITLIFFIKLIQITRISQIFLTTDYKTHTDHTDFTDFFLTTDSMDFTDLGCATFCHSTVFF